MMIYFASIQGVPPSLMEAAEIDGANYFQVMKNSLFTLIAPAFTASMFLTLANSLKQFDVNYALTVGGSSGMFMGYHGFIKSVSLELEESATIDGSVKD